jgi:hypothetical protein
VCVADVLGSCVMLPDLSSSTVCAFLTVWPGHQTSHVFSSIHEVDLLFLMPVSLFPKLFLSISSVPIVSILFVFFLIFFLGDKEEKANSKDDGTKEAPTSYTPI